MKCYHKQFNKKNMKKYVFICIIVGLSFSCENFLDLGPENRINTQSYYKSQNDVQTILVGAYSSLQGIHNINLHYLGDMATDNGEIQLGNPSASELQFDQIAFSASNDYVGSYWTSCYSLITRCNTVLNHVEKVGFDDATKKSIQGQCRFLRAYGYFLLVRMFGEVTVVYEEFTSPDQVAAYDMRRKPIEEVYTLMVDDLTEAEKLLPAVVPADRGQASIGAVKTLLAKIYLTRKEYGKALIELEAVMALKKADGSKAYDLYTGGYGKLFSEKNDDLIESIFEVEFASGNIGEGNSYAAQFYPLIQGMKVFKGDLLGGGRCVPTQSLMDAYEPGDNRKDASMGDQLPITGGMMTSRFCKKFIDYNVTILSDGGVNFTAYRYADILLMYAEVLNELDRSGETYLNMVRDRAGLGPKTSLNKDDFRLAIEQERRVEFAFEQQRWFDLVRTGRLQVVMDAHFQSKGQAFTVAAHEWILPVPQAQRDIDPNLTQNDKY